MRWKAIGLSVIVLVCFTLRLSGAGPFKDRATMRFRMTVEIETPDGLRTGSSVLELSAEKHFRLTSEEHQGSVALLGEAVVVDLPDGPVFALLTTGDAKPLLATQIVLALEPDADGHDAGALVASVRRLGEEPGKVQAEIPRKHWPVMVSFRDLNDPMSMKHRDPELTGVRRIVVEVTHENLTVGNVERLNWLSQAEDFKFAGTPYSTRFPLPATQLRSAH